jgi:putative spermidine/putrescine transport system permease protein
MLAFDPDGYSLKHYQTSSPTSGLAAGAVELGDDRAGGDDPGDRFRHAGGDRPVAVHVPFKAAIMAVLISPMIVPLIISAAGMYFFYSRIGLQGTYWGVVLAHAALGTLRHHHRDGDAGRLRPEPDAGRGQPGRQSGDDLLQGADAADPAGRDLRRAVRLHHLLRRGGGRAVPGLSRQKTLPWQMFTGLREQISPTILAVATLMVAISIVSLLTVLEGCCAGGRKSLAAMVPRTGS